MSKIYVRQHVLHPNPPSSATSVDLSPDDSGCFADGCYMGTNGSSNMQSQVRTSPNPAVLERTSSVHSTGSSSSGSGSKEKKSVVFQLEHNQICESQQIVEFECEETNHFDNFQGANTVSMSSSSPSSSSSSPSLFSGSNYVCTAEEGMSSNYHTGSIFISKNTSPFRPGGRGSKMLAKAIEQSHKAAKTEMDISSDLAQMEPQWVLCTGKTPCFAKVMSNPSPDSSSVFIQPMHHSPTDNSLLVPWEGHLWLAKNNCLRQVKMKQEPGGWRVMLTSEQQNIVKDLQEKTSFVYPTSYATVKNGETKNWDLVSLESSEFDETGSADSGNSNSLFPLLGSAAGIAVPKSGGDYSTSSVCSSSYRVSYLSNSTNSSSIRTPSPMMVNDVEPSKTVKISPIGINSHKYRRKLERTPSPVMSGTTENESTSSSPSVSTNEPCTNLSLSADAPCNVLPAERIQGNNRAPRAKILPSKHHNVYTPCSHSINVHSNEDNNYDSDATEPIDDSPVTIDTSEQCSTDEQLDTPDINDDPSVLFYRGYVAKKEKPFESSCQGNSSNCSSVDTHVPVGHRKPPLSSKGASRVASASNSTSSGTEMPQSENTSRPPMPRNKLNTPLVVEPYHSGNSSGRRESSRQALGVHEDDQDKSSRAPSTTEILQKYRQKTLHDKNSDESDSSRCGSGDNPVVEVVKNSGLHKEHIASKTLLSSPMSSSSISSSSSSASSSSPSRLRSDNSTETIQTAKESDLTQSCEASALSYTPKRNVGGGNVRKCFRNEQLPTTPEEDIDAALHVVNNWDIYAKSTYPWPLLWRYLYALGWRELNIKRVHYKADVSDMTTVFIPSWAIEKFELEDRNPADMTKNRDLFVTQMDVRDYIIKYGVSPTDASVTPGGRKRQERRSRVTSFDEENAAPQHLCSEMKLPVSGPLDSSAENRTFSAIEMEKVSCSNDSVDTVAEFVQDSQVSNISSSSGSPQGSQTSKQSPGTPGEHKDAAKYIVNNWEAIRKKEYPFPLLWDRLYKMGWRNIVLNDTSKNSSKFEMQTLVSHVFVPTWSSQRFEDCNQNLSMLTKNRDYFLDRESIRNYIMKYGTDETKSNVTPEGRRRIKPVADSLACIVTPHKKLRNDAEFERPEMSSKMDEGERCDGSKFNKEKRKRKFGVKKGNLTEDYTNEMENGSVKNDCTSGKKSKKNEKQSVEKKSDDAVATVSEVSVTLCTLQGNTPSPKRRSPKTVGMPATNANTENSATISATSTGRLPRSARARSQPSRDDALGSWPTRFQCSANGSWKL